MKKILLAAVLALSTATTAFAGPMWHRGPHGWNGGHRGWHGGYWRPAPVYGHWRRGWVAPVIGGVVVGGLAAGAVAASYACPWGAHYEWVPTYDPYGRFTGNRRVCVEN